MKILKLLVWIVLLFAAYIFFLRSPDQKKGESAPDFTAELITGEQFNLSDLRGDYVLLDFWGSWCGPCIRESPELVRLNDDFAGKSINGDKAFHVVTVALEKNDRTWRRAAERMGFDWKYQIVQESKVVLLSPIAQKYAVSEIPAKFLIDPEGNVIGVNQSFDEIRQVLSGTKKDS